MVQSRCGVVLVSVVTLFGRPLCEAENPMVKPSMGTASLEPRRGGGEKSAWYPLFAHALNYNIKPRGFMQMTSQNFPSVNNDVYTMVPHNEFTKT